MLDGIDENNSKPPTIVIPEDQIVKIVQNKWTSILGNVGKQIQQKTQPFRVWIKELQ